MKSRVVWFSISWLAVLALAILPIAASCGEGMDSAAEPPQPPDTAEFANYADRCLRATDSWSKAKLIFDPEITMKQGRSSTVRAKLSLDTGLEPEVVMPNARASSMMVRVSCEAEAAIVANSEDFDLSPLGYVSQSVFEGQDADWHWVVEPKKVGTYDISLRIRPVILVNGTKANVENAAAEVLVKQRPFELPAQITVHVQHRNWLEALTDWMKTTEGAIAAITSVIVALGLLIAAVRHFGK